MNAADSDRVLTATPPGYARFAWLVLAFNLLVILVGTVVRATGSGDGCGSHWPVCNGDVIPVAPELKTIIEFTHRVVSGLDGLLVLALVFFGFKLTRSGNPLRKAVLWTLFLTLIEALIGRYLVKARLVADNSSVQRAIWMSIHLCNTFFLLTALTLTAWWASGREKLKLSGQGTVGAMLALGFLSMLALGVSGAITALGDTLYPARSHEEVMRLASQPDAPFLLRLRILHPYIAGSVGLYLLLIAGLVAYFRPSLLTRRWGQAVGWLFLAQILVGLVNLFLKAPVAMQVFHLLMADLVWIAFALLSASATAEGVVKVEALSFTSDGAVPAEVPTGPVTWREYLSLTKPRVISLLLFTTITAMFVAANGWPKWDPLLAALLGGYLSAGAANATNMVIDRDIDAKMKRTARRPTVTSRIPGPRALAFAMCLALGSFMVLWLGANLLAAMLSLAGLVFYVVVYTLLLKRRTTQNIVIGGAAGCFPPLVGWAAVTGDLKGMLAWYLFAIIFVWTPAHFWALAMLIKDEYAEVGVPMLPSVVGDRVTVGQILVYAVITAGVSLLPLAQGLVGWVYSASALLLGLLLIGRSVALLRRPDRPGARSMYLYSMAYLALLFLALAIDRSVLA
jgi:protoheme IX farnesyltransferase